LLLTRKRVKIGEMSCNPASGGLGKRHLVRVIDARTALWVGRSTAPAFMPGRAIDRARIYAASARRGGGSVAQSRGASLQDGSGTVVEADG
jgi:tRNA U34 5-carboxymethylaminomethyl modifying enzyme MnmG/GidA